MNLRKAEPLLAGLLLVGFFLPWVSFGGIIEVSGYNLTRAMQGLNQLAADFGSQNAAIPAEAYAVYLIPLCAIGILGLEIAGRPSKLLAVVGGIIPIMGFAYMLTKAGTDLFDGLAIGVYITLAAAIGLVLAGLNIVTLGKETTTTEAKDSAV